MEFMGISGLPDLADLGGGSDVALYVNRTTTSATTFALVAGIEFMPTAQIGVVAPADGFQVDVIGRGEFVFDYTANSWSNQRAVNATDVVSYAHYSDADWLLEPATGVVTHLMVPPTTTFLNGGAPIADVQFSARPYW
jgi:hypothetical protein